MAINRPRGIRFTPADLEAIDLIRESLGEGATRAAAIRFAIATYRRLPSGLKTEELRKEMASKSGKVLRPSCESNEQRHYDSSTE